MGQIFVRASRRARAHTRSSIARIKKTSGLMRKLFQKGPSYKSARISSQRGKLYSRLTEERSAAVDALYKKHRGGAQHIWNTIRRASR